MLKLKGRFITSQFQFLPVCFVYLITAGQIFVLGYWKMYFYNVACG
jgi:hypothetical protein